MKTIKQIFIILLMALWINGPVNALEKLVTLSVPTMNCPVCPITVKKSLMNVDGVQSANVSLDKKTAIVTFDDQLTDVDSLLFATEMAGYPSSLIEK